MASGFRIRNCKNKKRLRTGDTKFSVAQVGVPGSTEPARKDRRMCAHSRYLQRPAAADERVPGRRYAEAGGKLGNGRSPLKISQRKREHEVRLEHEYGVYNEALGLVGSGGRWPISGSDVGMSSLLLRKIEDKAEDKAEDVPGSSLYGYSAGLLEVQVV